MRVTGLIFQIGNIENSCGPAKLCLALCTISEFDMDIMQARGSQGGSEQAEWRKCYTADCS